MMARIYDKDMVSLSSYVEFGDDKTMDHIKQWFLNNYRVALENITYFVVITGNGMYYKYNFVLELIEQENLNK